MEDKIDAFSALTDIFRDMLIATESLAEMKGSLRTVELCMLLITALLYVTVAVSVLVLLCRYCSKRQRGNNYRPPDVPIQYTPMINPSKNHSTFISMNRPDGAPTTAGQNMNASGLDRQSYPYGPTRMVPRIQIECRKDSGGQVGLDLGGGPDDELYISGETAVTPIDSRRTSMQPFMGSGLEAKEIDKSRLSINEDIV